jgi:hypothetical protein
MLEKCNFKVIVPYREGCHGREGEEGGSKFRRPIRCRERHTADGGQKLNIRLFLLTEQSPRLPATRPRHLEL